MKKYEFVGAAKEIVVPPAEMTSLHPGDANRYSYVRRIRALRDFGNVKKGEIGGWIESENNLSHEGLSWVGGNAIVCSEAFVYEDALVQGCALVIDNARVYGSSCVRDESVIHGHAMIYGQSKIRGGAEICGNARVLDNARIGNDIYPVPFQIVCGDAQVFGDAVIINPEVLCDDARIHHGGFKGYFEHMVFSFSDSVFRYFTYTPENRKWNFSRFTAQTKHKLKYRALPCCFSMSTEDACRFVGKKNAAVFKLLEKEEQVQAYWASAEATETPLTL
jgi:hypothetical protein